MTRTGKSHSIRPISKRPPLWLKYTPEEIIALVIQLAKDENSASMIGIILRDQFGIPLVKPITGKSISQIIKESELSSSLPEDLENLIKKGFSKLY